MSTFRTIRAGKLEVRFYSLSVFLTVCFGPSERQTPRLQYFKGLRSSGRLPILSTDFAVTMGKVSVEPKHKCTH